MQHFKTEWNPLKNATERWYWDADTETMTIKNTFDVTDIIEHNKAAQNASLDSRYGNQMMHHVAEIPLSWVVKFKKEHNLDIFNMEHGDEKRFRKLLELPEYRFLKTTLKKLWRPV